MLTSCYTVCIGRHVISQLSDVTIHKIDVSFNQDGGHKCRVKYERKRIQHAFVDLLDISVPRVPVWHHSVELRDAKQ